MATFWSSKSVIVRAHSLCFVLGFFYFLFFLCWILKIVIVELTFYAILL